MAVSSSPPTSPPPLAPEHCRVVANPGDLIIQVPDQGGVSVVNHFHAFTPQGGPTVITRRETHLMSTERIGKLLANMEPAETAENTSGWIDLLAVATPGIALRVQKGQTTLVLTLPARTKTLHQNQTNVLGNLDDRPRLIDFPIALPPSTWVLRYGKDGKLRYANFFLSDTLVRSVVDTTPCRIFPLGNSYSGHGAICWGNVNIGALRVEDPLAVDNLFFATPFNQDLISITEFHGGVQSSSPAGFLAWSRVDGWMRWVAENPAEHGPRLQFVGPTIPFNRRLQGIQNGGE
jgi:hypothetical protein